jgi:hypothetical protein
MENIAVHKLVRSWQKEGTHYVDKSSQGIEEFHFYLEKRKSESKSPFLLLDVLYAFLCRRILFIGEPFLRHCLIQVDRFPGLGYIMVDLETEGHLDSSFLTLLRWLSFPNVTKSKLSFAKFIITYAFGGSEKKKIHPISSKQEIEAAADLPIQLPQLGMMTSYYIQFVSAFMQHTRVFYRKMIQKVNYSAQLRLLADVIQENGWE